MADDSGSPHRDLAVVADELAETLRDLQSELDDSRGPPRGPLGLPRPPTPRETLRFADEVAIPATIAVLQANVKLLEALQRAIRLADTEREVRDRGTRAGERAVSASRAGLSRLERALEDLQTAVENSDLPSDETARDLLEDARRLRDEIDDRLREAGDRTGEQAGRTVAGPERAAPDGSQEDRANDGGEDVQVDVEGELESLKRRYGKEDGRDGPPTGEDGGDDA